MKQNNFSIIIKNERDAQNITISELSRRAGVPYSTLSQIEKGRVIPQIVTFEKIIGALGYELILMRKKDLAEYTEIKN